MNIKLKRFLGGLLVISATTITPPFGASRSPAYRQTVFGNRE